MTEKVFVIQNQTTRAFFTGKASNVCWTSDTSKARFFADEVEAVYYRDNLQALGANVQLVTLADIKAVAPKLDPQKLDADFDAWYQDLAKDLPLYQNPQTKATCWLTWKAASRNAVKQQTQDTPAPTPAPQWKVYQPPSMYGYATFEEAVRFAKRAGREAAIMEYTGLEFAGWYRVNLKKVEKYKTHGFILRAVLELQVNTNI